MNSNCFKKKTTNVIITTSLALIILVISSVAWLSVTMTDRLALSKADEELRLIADEQASLVKDEVESQIEPLYEFAESTGGHIDFSTVDNEFYIKKLAELNGWRSVGYADMDGNVTDFDGKKAGNVSDREYFKRIVIEKEEHACQYLKKNNLDANPSVVFSVPVKRNGEMTGVLFAIKKVDSIAKKLFKHNLLRNNASEAVIDSDNNVLVKNTGQEDDKTFTVDSENCIIAESPIEMCGWHLVCSISKKEAKNLYAHTFMYIKETVIIMTCIFLFVTFYFLGLTVYFSRRKKKQVSEYEAQVSRYKKLLEKKHSIVAEYDVETGEVKADEGAISLFGKVMPKRFFDNLGEYHKLHPEFDHYGLKRELDYAIESKTPCRFESTVMNDCGEYHMMMFEILPITDIEGNVRTVVGLVTDSTDEHSDIAKITSIFNKVPGGTHRCYLSDPIHLEYASEGLCKMLGYSEEEFDKIVGADRDYCQAIMEEDREKFEQFIVECASSPGVRTCEYAMKCKDGRSIYVLDTMESIHNESGIMYGYSAVTDVSEYKKQQNIARQEMIQLEQSLEMARVKNSTSQMQPHFLYNALGSIREIILDDPDYASDLICDFTTYLRSCIKSMSNDDLITMNQEIENIKAYVNIEKMRMGERLEVCYELDCDGFMIVPLTIQPLVENAIRHGIFKRGKAGGKVTIKSSQLTDYYVISVEDNGVGFDYQKIRDEIESGERDSTGLDNVLFRLKKLMNAVISIDSVVGKGTKITIRIPKEISDESNNSR